MDCFQVTDREGRPAVGPPGTGMCIFPTDEDARKWKEYLEKEYFSGEKFRIRKVQVTIRSK